MPLKLNVGQANYGSRGASIHLELDAGLAGEPDRIRQMFH